MPRTSGPCHSILEPSLAAGRRTCDDEEMLLPRATSPRLAIHCFVKRQAIRGQASKPGVQVLLAVLVCAVLLSLAGAERLPRDLRQFVADGEILASAERAKSKGKSSAERAQQYVHGTMAEVTVPTQARPQIAAGPRPGDGLATERSGLAGVGDGAIMLRDEGKGVIASALRDEKMAAQNWKNKANELKAQVVNQRQTFNKLSPTEGAREQRSASGSSMAQRLNRAKADATVWRQKAESYQAAVTEQGSGDDALTSCDGEGCWTIDTTDATTRATLNALNAAAGPTGAIKPPIAALAAAANAAAAAKSAQQAPGQPASAKHSHMLSDEKHAAPAHAAMRPKCDNPYHHVDSPGKACKYVRANCLQHSGIFSYPAITYCTLGGSPTWAMVVLAAWLVALSVWLGMAADLFLCPCLTVMSKVCHMSENVAGLTFLALGNGAPDIFSQIAASISSPSGAEMALGEMLGPNPKP